MLAQKSKPRLAPTTTPRASRRARPIEHLYHALNAKAGWRARARWQPWGLSRCAPVEPARLFRCIPQFASRWSVRPFRGAARQSGIRALRTAVDASVRCDRVIGLASRSATQHFNLGREGCAQLLIVRRCRAIMRRFCAARSAMLPGRIWITAGRRAQRPAGSGEIRLATISINLIAGLSISPRAHIWRGQPSVPSSPRGICADRIRPAQDAAHFTARSIRQGSDRGQQLYDPPARMFQ